MPTPRGAGRLAGLLLATVLLAGLAPLVRAGPRVHLPLLLERATPASPGPGRPLPSPTPMPELSAVLVDVPVYPGARLSLFDVRPLDAPPAALALYDPPTAIAEVSRVVAWYRAVLPGLGWRQVAADAAGGRWERAGGAWLSLRYGPGADGPLRLALTRDVAGVRPTGGRSLVDGVPLPEAARRTGFDAVDLLAEALEFPATPAAARAALSAALGAAGWREVAVASLSEATYVLFDRSAVRLLAAFRPLADGAQIDLGRAACMPQALPLMDAVVPARSVYLAELPLPAGLELVGFERLVASREALERWRGSCGDLDVLAAALRAELASGGWQLRPDGFRRWPGAVMLDVQPLLGTPVAATLRPLGQGVVELALRRAEVGRRHPERTSLLWSDLPLPTASDAWQLETNTVDGWQWRETYRFPPDLDSRVAAWFRSAMRSTPWQFERLEPAGEGPAQVYGADGEELLVNFVSGTTPTVVLARRRICPGAQPVAPPASGVPARRVAELLVYPGAAYAGFESDTEHYTVSCAATGLIADWYHVLLERGNWRLVSSEYPGDVQRRRLRFARPDEIAWPPDRRSAWAEVEVQRPWPYQYALRLRRDPGGVLPGQGRR